MRRSITTLAVATALAGPVFWTGKIGYLLPTDPQIPVHVTHCDGNVCVGTLGTVQGHNYKWLMGRDPVYRLKSYAPAG